MMFSSWCIQVLLNYIILALRYLTWGCLRLLALILVAYLSVAQLHMNLEYLTLSLLESLILSFIVFNEVFNEVFNVHFICVTGASWSSCLLVTGSTLLVLSKFDNIAMKRSPLVMQCFTKPCPVFQLTFFLFVLQNVLWTPSKVIARLGKEINNESSYLYWAYKVNVYQVKLNFMHTSRIYFLFYW